MKKLVKLGSVAAVALCITIAAVVMTACGGKTDARAIRDLRVAGKTANTITIAWTAPSESLQEWRAAPAAGTATAPLVETDTMFMGYQIREREAGGTFPAWPVDTTVAAMTTWDAIDTWAEANTAEVWGSYTADELKPGTTYNFEIRAVYIRATVTDNGTAPVFSGVSVSYNQASITSDTLEAANGSVVTAKDDDDLVITVKATAQTGRNLLTGEAANPITAITARVMFRAGTTGDFEENATLSAKVDVTLAEAIKTAGDEITIEDFYKETAGTYYIEITIVDGHGVRVIQSGNITVAAA